MSHVPNKIFTVKVDNIDHTISEANLYGLFNKYGSIDSVNIPDPSKSWGYVNFISENDANSAVLEMNDKYANGRALKVTLKQIGIQNLTDCRNKHSCEVKDCGYRHNTTNNKECKYWRSKKCYKIDCLFAHPSPSLPSPSLQTIKQVGEPSDNQSCGSIETVQRSSSEIAFKEKFEEMCQCAICYEMMEFPKSLSCNHSFCKECLEKCDSFVSFNSFLQVTIRCPYNCPDANVLQNGQTIGTGLSTELTLKQSLDILKGSEESSSTNPSKCSKSNCIGPPDRICRSCGFLICQSCSPDHSARCQSDRTVEVKFSTKEGSLMSYCSDHDCLCHFVCCNCDTPLCMYCKAWSHNRDHAIISLVEYEKKFDVPLMNCLNGAKERKTFFKNLKKDINISSTKDVSEVLNHLNDTRNKILAKFLYIFDNVERQIKGEFETVCGALRTVNNDMLKKSEDILSDTQVLTNSSSIEKIIRTRTLIDKLEEIPYVADGNQNGFRVDINSDLQNDDLEKTLSKLVEDGLGRIQISLKTDSWLYRPISPNFENILQSAEFQELGDSDKSKEYLNKFGFPTGKDKNSKKKKNKGNKTKKEKEQTVKSVQSEGYTTLEKSQSLIDLASDDDFTEQCSTTGLVMGTAENTKKTKRKQKKKEEQVKEDILGIENINLINFDDDHENEKSFKSMIQNYDEQQDTSSDEDENDVSISGDSENSFSTSTDNTQPLETNRRSTHRSRKWRRGGGQRGGGSNVERGGVLGMGPSGFRGGRGQHTRGRGQFRAGRGPYRGGRGHDRGGGGTQQRGTNYRNLSHAQSVNF